MFPFKGVGQGMWFTMTGTVAVATPVFRCPGLYSPVRWLAIQRDDREEFRPFSRPFHRCGRYGQAKKGLFCQETFFPLTCPLVDAPFMVKIWRHRRETMRETKKPQPAALGETGLLDSISILCRLFSGNDTGFLNDHGKTLKVLWDESRKFRWGT